MTPIEVRGGALVKREDMFVVAGARGSKARVVWSMAQGARGLVTAGNKHSPQIIVVGAIAARLGIPCRVWTAQGALTPEMLMAAAAGAEVTQVKMGMKSVLVKRSADDAYERGWKLIPFGLECAEAVECVRGQVANVPKSVRRIVVPCGGGVMLAAVLRGMKDYGLRARAVGVLCISDVSKTLDRLAPSGWRESCALVPSGLGYHERVDVELDGLKLDPVYEAKCVKFLRAGDLLWVVGIRPEEVL